MWYRKFGKAYSDVIDQLFMIAIDELSEYYDGQSFDNLIVVGNFVGELMLFQKELLITAREQDFI